MAESSENWLLYQDYKNLLGCFFKNLCARRFLNLHKIGTLLFESFGWICFILFSREGIWSRIQTMNCRELLLTLWVLISVSTAGKWPYTYSQTYFMSNWGRMSKFFFFMWWLLKMLNLFRKEKILQSEFM